MARVAFLTLYDNHCIGMRILANLLDREGHTVEQIFFKRESSSLLDLPRDDAGSYQVLIMDKLYGYQQDVNPITPEEERLLLDRLATSLPDMVGISSRSFMDEYNVSLLRKIRDILPRALLVAGGYGPTLSPRRYLDACDVVVLGEGELAITELAKTKDSDGSYESIPGVAFLRDGEMVTNPLAVPPHDLDQYPHPTNGRENMVYIDGDRVVHEDPSNDYRVFSVLAGRGCVGKCSYCSAGQWGARYRSLGQTYPTRRNRSVTDVIDEIKSILTSEKRDVQRVSFIDTYLVGSRGWMLNLFRAYKREIGLPFTAQLHHDQIKTFPEVLKAACDAGFARTTVGVQGGEQAFRKRIYNRKASDQVIINMARAFVEHGIGVNYHFIAGNPLENERELYDGIEFMASLPKVPERDLVSVFQLKIFPGTTIASKIAEAKAVLPPTNIWFWQALLYLARMKMSEGEFRKLYTNTKYRARPDELYAYLKQLDVVQPTASLQQSA